ncbi:MAG: hypothetical protein P857_416 [Candidatus Xenolissoclinum pacificiensis L6]|uniref:Small ribosomal subunit protein bS6 n=1 Tax=Candidatus Xenolissoclinum pacificiensis L6 TaxID=1401685 RepID=W2V0W7_9RICK|nr:MAG: hypothetical protein P857_416 [Candidatus Xenolissoclinum pacificiensis L6]
MYIYEATFLVTSSLSDSEVSSLINTTVKSLCDGKVELILKEYYGLVDLAYVIGKVNKAHVFVLFLKTDSNSCVQDCMQKTKYNKIIIRTMLLRHDIKDFDISKVNTKLQLVADVE